jgi:hypothetical protein
MAIKLSANYSKKLGLPEYSSHSFSASVEVELTDITQVESECQKLYELLQHSVDQEIQQVGFVPNPGYGSNNGPAMGTVTLPTRTATVAPIRPPVVSTTVPMAIISPRLLVTAGTARMVSADSSCASSVTTRWKNRKPKICRSNSLAPASSRSTRCRLPSSSKSCSTKPVNPHASPAGSNVPPPPRLHEHTR